MKPEIKVKKIVVKKIWPASNNPDLLSGQGCFPEKSFPLFF